VSDEGSTKLLGPRGRKGTAAPEEGHDTGCIKSGISRAEKGGGGGQRVVRWPQEEGTLVAPEDEWRGRAG